MSEFLVLVHLVPVAQAPTVGAKILAIGSCKVVLQEFAKLFEFWGVQRYELLRKRDLQTLRLRKLLLATLRVYELGFRRLLINIR